MKNTFLDYYKKILECVSFDKELFNKEYQKALKTIDSNEVDEFQRWINSKGFE